MQSGYQGFDIIWDNGWRLFSFLGHSVKVTIGHPEIGSGFFLVRSLQWRRPCERHEDMWRSGAIVPLVLDIDTRWSYMVSFTSRSFYVRGKSQRKSFHRKLDGSLTLFGRGGWGKHLLTIQGIDAQIVGRAAHSLVTTPPELSGALVHRSLTYHHDLWTLPPEHFPEHSSNLIVSELSVIHNLRTNLPYLSPAFFSRLPRF